MNTIKLTPEQLEELKKIKNARAAALETIEHLSVKALEYEELFWRMCESWFPEIDTTKRAYQFDSKNAEINMIDL